MKSVENLVQMGYIKSAVGLKGWLKIKPFTEELDGLLQYSDWYIGNTEAGFKSYQIEDGKISGAELQVKLLGVDDRRFAEQFKGASITIPRAWFAVTDQDEYYWSDLIGMQVSNQDGHCFGVVSSLIETGPHVVLLIKDSEQKQILIPFVAEYVVSVDLENKQIRVAWGLDY